MADASPGCRTIAKARFGRCPPGNPRRSAGPSRFCACSVRPLPQAMAPLSYNRKTPALKKCSDGTASIARLDRAVLRSAPAHPAGPAVSIRRGPCDRHFPPCCRPAPRRSCQTARSRLADGRRPTTRRYELSDLKRAAPESALAHPQSAGRSPSDYADVSGMPRKLRCACASRALSKMWGATSRSRKASPSLLRRKTLVV